MTRSPVRILSTMAVGAMLALLPGCSPSQKTDTISAEQGIGPESVTPEEIEALVRTFADRHVSMVSQACDQIADQAETPEERSAGHQLKLNTAHAAISIAASRSSIAALIDMVVMVTLNLQAVEDYWNPQVFDGHAEALVEALRKAHADIWATAKRVFYQAQLDELRSVIEQWRAEHPEQVYVTHVRFSDFALERPEQIGAIVSAEREAAVEQIQQAIGTEREALMGDLQEPVLRGLLFELRQTLEAGTALSDSLNATAETVAALAPKEEPE